MISTTASQLFCSLEGDTKPWFQIKLQDSFVVMKIDVINRKDMSDNAMDFEYIQVSYSMEKNTQFTIWQSLVLITVLTFSVSCF